MRYRLFTSCALAVSLFGSCTVLEENVPGQHGELPIEIEGYMSGPSAKATAEGFGHDDAIGLYAVNYTADNTQAGVLSDSGNQADNVLYRYNLEKNTWIPNKGVYYKDAKTNVDIYAYYPYGSPAKVNAYDFEVRTDQSVRKSDGVMGGYEASDFLWAEAGPIVPGKGRIKLLFSHRMSSAKLELVPGTGFAPGEFEQLKKIAMIENTCHHAKINLADGTVLPEGEVGTEGIVMLPDGTGFHAIVVPQTVPAGKTLITMTVGGVNYTYRKDIPFTYPAGKCCNFKLTVNKKSPSGEFEFIMNGNEIIPWTVDPEENIVEAKQYYIVNLTAPGTLGSKLRENKKDPAKIKNLKIEGVADASDFYFIRDTMKNIQAVNMEGVLLKPWTDPDNSYYSFKSDEIPDFAFEESGLTSFVFPEGIRRIRNGAFSHCKFLSGAIVIPDSVVDIDHNAYSNCSNITSIVLPSRLERIGSYAFGYCTSLKCKLSFPNTLKRIESSAFMMCSGLYGPLILPDNLECLEQSAFNCCSGFTGDLRIPEKITTVTYACFTACEGLKGKLILHDNIENIEGSAFCFTPFSGELKLPEKLKHIGDEAFNNSRFTGIAYFPEGLMDIGNNTFANSQMLRGKIELNEELVMLGDWAFCNTGITEVVLPSNLGVVKHNTFTSCSHLHSITCKSIEPPILFDDSFSGVQKPEVVLQVPKQSINRYKSDPEWGKFQRITASRRFNINRREVGFLNAAAQRTLILDAASNISWTVSSKPDWVEVSPLSGTGKQKVTISVKELLPADAVGFLRDSTDFSGNHYQVPDTGRNGKIVFTMDQEDAALEVDVSQYDYQYADGDVVVLNKATKGKGVNVVFLGDCYDALDVSLGRYLDDLKEGCGHFFDIEPYKTYRDYFNVYAVVGVSNDSGLGSQYDVRDCRFGSQYAYKDQEIEPDLANCYEYMRKADVVNGAPLVESETLITLVVNSSDYRGICYMYEDGSAIAVCAKSTQPYPMDFRGLIQHEAGGHGFGKLADEYVYHDAFVGACDCLCCKHLGDFMSLRAIGFYRNLDVTNDVDKVEWSHLIYKPGYSDYVDVYEGGYYHSKGIFRSEPESCMDNNIPYYSAISRQVIVERIKSLAGEPFSLEDFYRNDVLTIQPVTKTWTGYSQNVEMKHGHGPVIMGKKPEFK